MNRILAVVFALLAILSAGCTIAGTGATVNPFDWSEPPLAKAPAPVTVPPGQPTYAMANR